MNNLSTSELQHYTKTKEILVSILKNGFVPAFCKEVAVDNTAYFLPMVCFCDIPMDLAQDHREWYGDYVIAMKPEWALSNNIHPVHYIRKPMNEKHNLNSAYDCIIRNYFESMKPELEKIGDKCYDNLLNIKAETNNNTDNVISAYCKVPVCLQFIYKLNFLFYPLSLMIAYQKPLEGYQKKHFTKNEGFKKFYDEREWRYIPYLEELNDYFTNVFFDYFFEYTFVKKMFFGFHLKYDVLKEIIPNENVISLKLNGDCYEKIKKYSLKFLPKDVAYIITPDESDIFYIKKEAKMFEDVEMKNWK